MSSIRVATQDDIDVIADLVQDQIPTHGHSERGRYECRLRQNSDRSGPHSDRD